MMQNAGVFNILTCKCAWRHSGVPFFHHFSTYERPKVVRTPQFFDILTLKCASRYSGVQFFHIATSKSGPRMLCFVHFDFKMCFSLQRRAIFPHRNFKKWSENAVFCTFWLQNVLLATAACNFSTSQLQKVVWSCGVLYILTSKCASRYSGVQFFMSPLNSYLRTRHFTEVTVRSSRHTNHWKTQHFATSLTFRACGSSFYWLSRNCIFFLLTLLLFSAFSSSDSASLLCFFNCPYCRKLDSMPQRNDDMGTGFEEKWFRFYWKYLFSILRYPSLGKLPHGSLDWMNIILLRAHCRKVCRLWRLKNNKSPNHCIFHTSWAPISETFLCKLS